MTVANRNALCSRDVPGRETPWVEISLDNLYRNLTGIRRHLPRHTDIIAVVKDSAYGCGAREITQALERAGVPMFAVARIAEARELREFGVKSSLLVLGDASPDDYSWIVSQNIHIALNDIRTAAEFARYQLPLPVHVNIDTGMGRLGVRPHELGELLEVLRGSQLRVVGIYTHFACADKPGHSSVALQLQRFEHSMLAFRAAGYAPSFVHCANSAGIVNAPWPDFVTHCRPGIMLYGCRSDPLRNPGLRLYPIASLKGRVVHIMRVERGTPISYGWTYRAPGVRWIATVNIGYGHGLPRFLSNRGHIIIRGRRYPIVGRVTMDYSMVDVGTRPCVRVGDEAVAIGRQGSAQITPDEVAAAGGTIAYEILCNLGVRIPRYYISKSTRRLPSR